MSNTLPPGFDVTLLPYGASFDVFAEQIREADEAIARALLAPPCTTTMYGVEDHSRIVSEICTRTVRTWRGW